MKKLVTLLLVTILAFSVFAGCGDEQTSSPNGPVEPAAEYTYNAAAATLPTNWNTHTYQANDANTVLSYTEDGFYTFDYNEEKNGYKIVPAMAKDFPVDVTAQYVGKYGIKEGDKSKVYKIELRDDLKFDNGDEIHAVDFVESVKRLLDYDLANYRADTVYSGSLKIYNAKEYFYNGHIVYDPAVNVEGYGKEITSFDGLLFDASNVNAFGDIFGYTDMAELSGYKSYFAVGEENYYDFFMQYHGENRTAMTQEIADKLAGLFGEDGKLGGYWGWVDTEIGYFSVVACDYPEMEFSSVGIFADENDENVLYIALSQELSGFYLHYALTGSLSLVHTETYDACIVEESGVKSSTYGTSKESYIGYGAYRLDSFIADNSCSFVKNEHWYGYNDAENEGLYQTTKIQIKCIADEATRLNEFLAGNLDSYGLQAADMADYQSSPYTYFTEGDSTWFIAINPKASALADNEKTTEPMTAGNEVDKQMLTIKEFRQALSFSVDRAAYALALDPLGGTAKALYGNMIVSDPENGTAYRTTEQAKDTILKFWGLTEQVGEGKLYADKDEAIASITGYDLAGAKALFNAAYEQAVADKMISAEAIASGNWEVQILIGQPGSGSSSYYNNGYEFLKKTWTDAVIGTELEGHLTFRQSQPLGSSGFANYLRNNSIDLLFGVGWTGSALDPYGLMEAYVAPNYQYDPAWDTSAADLDIEIGGKVLRASVYAWGKEALTGTTIKANVVVDGVETEETVEINAGNDADPTLRLNILAAVECAVLEQYNMIPVTLDCSANLKGMKITYGTEEYVYGVGRGGIKYMTYNYTDAQWAEFVASQGGKLEYKA